MALTRPRYSQIYDTDYKQSVRLATTADVGNLLTTGNMTNSVDGKTLQYLDRVLVKNQDDARQNGIYEVLVVGTGSNGTWRRALDADSSDKVTSGLTTTISEGDTNSATTWKLSTPDPITLGVTYLNFVNPFLAGSGVVGGSDQMVQFNDGGTIGGDAGFKYNKNLDTVTVANTIHTGNLIAEDDVRSIRVYADSYYYANGVPFIGGSNYGNTEVAAYLTTYSGNLTASSVVATNFTYPNGVSILDAVYSNLGGVSGTLATLTANAASQAGDIANLYANAASQSGDLTTLYSNAASQAGAITDLYSNAAAQAGQITTLYSNASIQAGAIADLYSNAALQSGNLAYIIGDISTLYANAAYQAGQIASTESNIATANTAMKGYVDGQITSVTNAWQANAGSQAGDIATLYANAASQADDISIIYANLGSVSGSIATLTSNAAIQAGQISTMLANAGFQAGDIATLTSNAAYQAGQIASTEANIGIANLAMKGYVDSVASNTSYGNANVASYLPVFGGNVLANNLLANVLTVALDNVAVTTGQIAWDFADKTFNMGMDSGVTLQVGQEQYIRVKAGEDITNGNVIMFGGAAGDNVIGVRANVHVAGFRDEYIIGVATQSIANNDFGYITTFGKVHDLDTNGWNVGDLLWVSQTEPGGLTNVEPVTGAKILVAAVIKKAGGNGHILVRPTFTPNLAAYATLVDISTANTAMKGYVDGEITSVTNAWQSNAAVQAGDIATLYSNAAYQSGAIASTESNIATANTAMKGYVDGQISTTNSTITTANTAMKGYVDYSISANIASLVNSAPAILDTLQELANALGNDASFSTTVTSLISNVNANIATLYSNAAIQSGDIATLYSNAAVQAGIIAGLTSYANANVASYLPTYSGNIGGTLTTASQPYVTTLGNITNLSVAGNVTTYGTTSTGNLTVNSGSAATYAIVSNTNNYQTSLGVNTSLGALSVAWGTLASPGNFMYMTASGGTNQIYTRNRDFRIITDNIVGDSMRIFAANAAIYLASNVASTSTTTGALQVSGGLGVVGNINAGNVLATNLTGTILTASQTNVTTVGNLTSLSVSGATSLIGVLYANANIASTNTATGAAVVLGGVGVSGNAYVGGRVGFTWANNVSSAYQIFNAATNSIDTVFG